MNKWLSIVLACVCVALGALTIAQRLQVLSAQAEASSAKFWASKTREQKEYETIYADIFENLNPKDHELVRSYLHWGFSEPNRGFESMLKKFDTEHPENQYWSLRKTMINTWQAWNMTEVYNRTYPRNH
jgi:hypothetical protein